MGPKYKRREVLEVVLRPIGRGLTLREGVGWFLKRDNFLAAVGLLLISVFILSAVGDFFWWLGHL